VPGTGATQDLSASDPGPTTTQNRTTTRVHVPDGYFLVLSGMIEDDKAQSRNQVPCLGGVPILGAAFSEKRQIDVKRNTMVFIRPRIIDTVEQIQNLTKHQQDIWDHKHRKKKMWLYETDEALDFFNINPKDETSFGNREFY